MPSATMIIGEFGFGVMIAGGFSPPDAERALNLVLTYTLGFVALEVPRIHQPEVSLEDLQQISEGIPEAVFPYTLEVKPGPGELVSQAQFDFGLDKVMESLAPLAGSRERI